MALEDVAERPVVRGPHSDCQGEFHPRHLYSNAPRAAREAVARNACYSTKTKFSVIGTQVIYSPQFILSEGTGLFEM